MLWQIKILLVFNEVSDSYFTMWIDCYFSIINHMTIYVVVLKMIMMPSCPYFILSTPLSLNMWTYFSISASAWGQVRSKLGGVGTSILHHAFISIFIALWVVLHIMSQYLCISSLILQGLHEEGECRQLDSGLEKEQNIRDLFCTTPKVLKLQRKTLLEYIKNIGRRKYQRGATHCPWGWRARPLPRGPHGSPPMPIFWYKVFLAMEKIVRKLSGRSATISRRNLGGTNLGLRWSCSAGETSLGRGKSSPSSSPSILSSGGGQSPSTSSPAPSPLKP